VTRFNDALAYALYFLGKWMRKEVKGTVEVPTDFGSLDANDLQTSDAARARGVIARDVYLRMLQQNGLLPNNFDYAANEAALKKEQETNVRPAEKQRSQGPDDGSGKPAGSVPAQG
jgi:hypothetical protein